MIIHHFQTRISNYFFLFLFLSAFMLACSSPPNNIDLAPYIGGWSGQLSRIDNFKFTFIIQQEANGKYSINTKGDQTNLNNTLKEEGNNFYTATIGDLLPIEIDWENSSPTAFLQLGHHLCYLDFQPIGDKQWQAQWNLFLSERFDPTFYLSLDQSDDGTYGAYTYFKSPICHYMYGYNFEQKGDQFTFSDMRSGIEFRAQPQGESIALEMNFLDEKIDLTLQKTAYDDWNIRASDLGIQPKISAKIDYDGAFDAITRDVQSDSLQRIHSVLIAKGGETVFEAYYAGFSSNIMHDTRSLSKTYASTAIGLAADKALPSKPMKDLYLKDFVDKSYPNIDWSDDKDKISFFHLLTMSSGLDAIDSRLDRVSHASEGSYQNQADWTQHILTAPMINEPGAEANYASANPHLVGPILQEVLDEDIEFYLHKNLFGPLDITNYRLQTDHTTHPYFGGGWLFTPQDLLKFGQLYLQKGKWKGQPILDESWVEESMQKHSVLVNTKDKNEYGYLFWHKTYQVNGYAIPSIEARGNGGQYIFIIPDYDLCVVTTAGNFGDSKTVLPELILEKYILPVFISSANSKK